MEIKKIKFKGNETQVSYADETNGTTSETTVKCVEIRALDFTEQADKIIELIKTTILSKLQEHAIAFVNGRRSQQDMFAWQHDVD